MYALICLGRRCCICVNMCFDMRVDICAEMCIDMCMDMCTVVCVDRSVDMCLNMCIDMPWQVSAHVAVSPSVVPLDRLHNVSIDICVQAQTGC